MIIDFHAHAYPDAVAPNALAHMGSLAHCSFYTDGTDSDLTASMSKANIDYSVVLPVVTNPAKTKSINNISIEKNGRNGLIYLGGMHPDTENYQEEMDRLKAAGIKGFKIHPQYQNTPIDDIRYLRILEYAAKLGLFVVAHAGVEGAYPDRHLSEPEMIRNVLRQVEGLTLIAAHMGGVQCWDRVTENLLDTGVYLDASCVLGRLKTASHRMIHKRIRLMRQEKFLELVHTFGADRILFGSDSPWTSQKESVKTFMKLPLSEEEKDRILYKNASQLLGL